MSSTVHGPGASRRRPRDRYDERPPVLQRVLAALLVLVVMFLVVQVIRTLWERAAQDVVSGRVIAFRVESDRAVRISLEVNKEAGGRAFCIVRARGASGAEVGKDVAQVDTVGTPESRMRLDYVLTTSERAVTGELSGCSPAPIEKDPDHLGPAHGQPDAQTGLASVTPEATASRSPSAAPPPTKLPALL